VSSEATVRVSLSIRVGNQQYQSNPTTFQADVSRAAPASPGRVTVGVNGTSIDLSKVATAGFCWIQNLDETNFVEYGIRDPSNGRFYPLGELLPGEFYLLRLSRNILEDYTNTGTGTTGDVNQFWFKADTAPCEVDVQAFEK
jgi:hypothetical protein